VRKHAIKWNPRGKRKIDRPEITWQRSVESDTEVMNLSWGRLERLAQNRDASDNLICGLCTRKGAEGLLLIMYYTHDPPFS
jgi:hypothetical protein